MSDRDAFETLTWASIKLGAHLFFFWLWGKAFFWLGWW